MKFSEALKVINGFTDGIPTDKEWKRLELATSVVQIVTMLPKESFDWILEGGHGDASTIIDIQKRWYEAESEYQNRMLVAPNQGVFLLGKH